jgi:hypothetical protein
MNERLTKNFVEEMCEELKNQLSELELAKKREEHEVEHAAALLQRKASARTLLLERLAHGGALVLAVNAGRSPSELRVNKPRP